MPQEGLLERNFEADIEAFLISEQGGYLKGDQATYDKVNAIDLTTLITFLKDTQPREWMRYENIYLDNTEYQLKHRFNEEVESKGLIAVLRNGINDHGVQFRLFYTTPTSTLNEELIVKYSKNILTCTRQFAYSTQNNNTIDMVLSLNGIPIIAIELKNQFTGQSIEDSKRQWREDRNPQETLFHFNTRILAYFGVDLYNAVMTTKLDGRQTFFIPFNQGSNGAGNVGGAGNPPREDGHYITAYLWENVLQRDMLLTILSNYVMLQTEKKIKIIIDRHGNEKETSIDKTSLIFPRYHQLDVVEKLVKDTITNGSGTNYLIQHSAGSGKSNSIAWLTYRLATLHNANNEKIFNGVLVITDRRVLNKQLRETILSFDHSEGQIVTVTENENSSVLETAINEEKQIIVTTIQRFPYIYEKIGSRAGKRYAIIVDEAHSSQNGKNAERLNATLADTDEALQEWAEWEEKTEEKLEQERDSWMEDLLAQGRHSNLSFYAFTATPKPKTLQTFGCLIEHGETRDKDRYGAYHTYSMLQAIEEEFILDVLQNYTPFETSFQLEKIVKENPEYKETPATRALVNFYKSHQHTINKKAAIIVEKFREVTLNQMEGRAKAMVVTASRMHALRYYMAIKDYCRQNNIDNVHPLVAFSGSLNYHGEEYTEVKLNSTPQRNIREDRLPHYFESDLYNMLVVADKYQTGFDEPLLHTMFVDKKLKNVKAVQTLSRLNRSSKGKNNTYIFDFVNDAKQIKNAFEPFYTNTELIQPTDINTVYDLRTKIKNFNLWTDSDEESFASQYADIKKTNSESRLAKLSNIFAPVISKYNALSKEDKFSARSLIKNFVRIYSYMAQIVRTYDEKLLKAYIFADYLIKALPKNPREIVNINDKVMLLNSKIEEKGTESIDLVGKPKIKGENGQITPPPETKKDLLNNIIIKVNALYHGNFSDEDKVIVEGIIDRIQNNAGGMIIRQAQDNNETQFVESIFPDYFQSAAIDCYNSEEATFSRLFNDENLYNVLRKQIGLALYTSYRGNGGKRV